MLTSKLYFFYLFLGEEAEKTFQKLRDRYTRVKKGVQECMKSGTSSKALQKAQSKLDSLQFMQWWEEYIRPRKSKSNVLSQEEDVPEKFGDCEDSESDQDEPLLIIPKSQSKQKLETPKAICKANRSSSSKRTRKNEDIEDEEINLIRAVAARADEDGFDIFGKYVAEKMRKLRHSLTEDAMENIEFSITSMLMQARLCPSLFEANTANVQEQQAKHPMSFMELLKN